jgi:hypothetical protein
MKIALLYLLFCCGITSTPDLENLRTDYIKAAENNEIASKLFNELSAVKKTDDKVLVAYKGAVLTLMAKYAKEKQKKKDFFKEGAGLLEFAVTSAPHNIEIRVLRMSVQENSPKFLKYRQHVSEDKQFILDHFNDIPSNKVKAFVRAFIEQSNSFSVAEKDRFNRR